MERKRWFTRSLVTLLMFSSANVFFCLSLFHIKYKRRHAHLGPGCNVIYENKTTMIYQTKHGVSES